MPLSWRGGGGADGDGVGETWTRKCYCGADIPEVASRRALHGD